MSSNLKIDEYTGTKRWYNKDCQLHRLDGPAIENPNGYKEWWVDGINYTEEKYWNKISELQIDLASKPRLSRFSKLDIK